MFNKIALDEFLINEKINHYVYAGAKYKYDNRMYYKEQYNNRFYILYSKMYKPNEMGSVEYEFAGFFDCVEKVLYDFKGETDKIIGNSKLIKCSTFKLLGDKIQNDLEIYLHKFCSDNIKELKDKYFKEFNEKNESYFEYCDKEVEQAFVIDEIQDEVMLSNLSDRNNYEYDFKFSNNLIYNDYLNNPVETILKIGTWIQDNENELKKVCLSLFENEYKKEYLQEIIENKNNTFDYLYTNKKILNCIEKYDAVNLNITINYSGNTLTFKYPKNILVCDLKRCDRDSSSYGKAYEVVEEFLQQYKKCDDSWHNKNFDFENITSITYGKNVLYEKDIQKEQERSDIELEEIDI